MRKVKYVELIFENCETVKLEPSMFNRLVIDGITTQISVNCYQFENGEEEKDLYCKYLAITITEEGLNKKCEQGWTSYTLRERLRYNDITQIELHYEDKKNVTIFVDWADVFEFKNEYERHIEYDDKVDIFISKEIPKYIKEIDEKLKEGDEKK